MKTIARILLLLVSFGTILASAQTLPHFDNIIIVVQENRTPDNLFGSTSIEHLGCGVGDPFEPGVDIVNGGHDKNGLLCSTPRSLKDPLDPGHGHGDWVSQCDLDPMTGICKMDGTCLNPKTGIPDDCFAFVPESEADPYFQIAKNYGFANYMFQTNEGPSFPAHQFLISGSSAPTNLPSPAHYNWFNADNTSDDTTAGCANMTGTVPYAPLIDNTGQWPTLSFCKSHQGDPHCLATCYTHNTWMSLWDSINNQHGNNNGWLYYLPPGADFVKKGAGVGIWNGPLTNHDLCVPNSANKACTKAEYIADMKLETSGDKKPILAAISSCNLAPVTWVIPDKAWSDHAGEDKLGMGPSWVASIVNAVGSNTTCGHDGKGYWYNDSQHSVAILITWDDWGGWFDHVNPSPYPGVNQTQGTWGAFYTYGFRVPLLVVSPYTQAGFVSGNLNTTGGQVFPFVHDFGSILAFTENNFLLPLGGIGPTPNNPNNFYADFYAPDSRQGNIPLQEFFNANAWRSFTQITPLAYGEADFQAQGTLDGPDANDSD
jgi:hypothetical protein